MTSVSSTIAVVVTGVIMDAAAQGLAIETEIQSKFSFAEVIETAVSAGFGGGFKAPDSLLSAGKTALHVGTVQVSTQLAEMAAGIRSKFDARAIALQISASLVNSGISNTLKINNVIGRNVASTAVNSVLGHAITKTAFNIEDISSQMISGVITDFSSSLVEPKYISAETPEIEVDLSEAEKVASMTLPEAKLNFQNVTGDDIRQSRPFRWQTETAKRSTWADKHPSQSQAIEKEIQQSQVSKQKGFMDYVGDFNSTVESIFVKPVQAAGDSIIHDVNTVLYGNSLSEQLMAGGNLLLDAAMVFGAPAAEAVGASVVSKTSAALSKFRFWKSAEVIESLGNFGANNHINALRLQQQLKIDQASSIFTETGKLRPEIIGKSDVIIPGQDLGNPKLIQELTRLGGDISDWGKYATKSVPSPSGNFQMHFYHNSLTSEVYYGMDYKAIFDHQGAWNIKPQPNFGYEPLRFNK